MSWTSDQLEILLGVFSWPNLHERKGLTCGDWSRVVCIPTRPDYSSLLVYHWPSCLLGHYTKVEYKFIQGLHVDWAIRVAYEMIRDRNKVLETNLIVYRCCCLLCLRINSMHMHTCRCTNMHMYRKPRNEKAGFYICENKGADQLLGNHSSS